MNDKQFYQAYVTLLGEEPTAMVLTQVRKLIMNNTYQQIYNAIWYFYIHKNNKNAIKQFGIGLLTIPKNMEEVDNYFKRLVATRQRASLSAKEFNNSEIEIKTIERQKRKVHREEFDWSQYE